MTTYLSPYGEYKVPIRIRRLSMGKVAKAYGGQATYLNAWCKWQWEKKVYKL